jgi:predicted ester cyclase
VKDFIIHMSNPDEKIHGSTGVIEYYTQLRKAFPDIHFTIDKQVAEDDRVVTQWTASGTHDGNFRGIAPTKRKFKISAIDVERIVDGKVVECWPSIDELSLLQQLGVTPPSVQQS